MMTLLYSQQVVPRVVHEISGRGECGLESQFAGEHGQNLGGGGSNVVEGVVVVAGGHLVSAHRHVECDGPADKQPDVADQKFEETFLRRHEHAIHIL